MKFQKVVSLEWILCKHWHRILFGICWGTSYLPVCKIMHTCYVLRPESKMEAKKMDARVSNFALARSKYFLSEYAYKLLLVKNFSSLLTHNTLHNGKSHALKRLLLVIYNKLLLSKINDAKKWVSSCYTQTVISSHILSFYTLKETSWFLCVW